MRYLKCALFFFFTVDLSIFLMSQTNSQMGTTLLPQFNIDSTDNTWSRSCVHSKELPDSDSKLSLVAFAKYTNRDTR
jgi:hypothetical protein